MPLAQLYHEHGAGLYSGQVRPASVKATWAAPPCSTTRGKAQDASSNVGLEEETGQKYLISTETHETRENNTTTPWGPLLMKNSDYSLLTFWEAHC